LRINYIRRRSRLARSIGFGRYEINIDEEWFDKGIIKHVRKVINIKQGILDLSVS